ncbi:MAG: ATP-binding protein [Polyangiaceae bacterium]|nr:ATP-binding protein [Polyangiaceae bacterium]
MERLARRLLPRGPGGFQAQLFVWSWLCALVFCVTTGLMFLWLRVWSQVLLNLSVTSLGLLMLALHRRGGRRGPLVHGSLAIASLALATSTLAQRPADYTSVGLMMLVPMLAGFLLPGLQARLWLLLSLCVAAGTITLVDIGWTLPFLDPMPAATHVLNMAVGLSICGFFAGRMEQMRQQNEEQHRALDEKRRSLLANVSHEIRTPMNGVLGVAEDLLHEDLPEAHRERVQTIHRSSLALVTLLNELLDLSRLEAGKFPLEIAPFHLDTLLADVRGLLEPQAREKGLELRVIRGEHLPDWLLGDRLRLTQVLNNLGTNAVKFTQRGSVELRVLRREGVGVGCRFEVEDTGPGISAELMPRLFQVFQQGDGSTTRRHGGAGLGLALSRQIVERLGGTLGVQSARGKGSTFTVDLALEEAAEPPPRQRSDHPKGQGLVLVVDDNSINLKVAVRLVERAGFQAEGVSNGQDAVAAIERGGYALVLMDCHMPEMDGFEATRRIRAMPAPQGQIPVVALTASTMPEDLEACRSVGMNGVLPKPVSLAALRSELSSRIS